MTGVCGPATRVTNLWPSLQTIRCKEVATSDGIQQPGLVTKTAPANRWPLLVAGAARNAYKGVTTRLDRPTTTLQWGQVKIREAVALTENTAESTTRGLTSAPWPDTAV